MSRAKELQEKLDVEAKLRNSFSNLNSTVLSWLSKDDDAEERGQEELNQSKKQFFALPLVTTGAGLKFGCAEGTEDINTVGEFVNSDKKITSLSKKKRRPQDKSPVNSIYRVSKDDTKAMLSLKRKMRKGKMEEMKKTHLHPRGPIKELSKHDSDSEENEPRVEKTKKKSIGLLFNGPKKRKK
ncbi:related to Nucleolar protein 19 [Zygosaccharomyces bailii]|nr:related to Nucleolar protein 19 [Zygosaccharomyces bailii]